MRKSVTVLFLLICISISCKSKDNINIFSKYNYYTSEKEVTIVGIINDSIFDNQIFKYKLYNNKGEAVQSGIIENSKFFIRYLKANLSLGHNILGLEIEKNNQFFVKKEIDIQILKPQNNEVKIDNETGGLIVSDLPYFPFGFYCGKVEKIPEREVVQGFNTIGPYQSNLPESFMERKRYMDRCAQLGVKVQYGVNSLVGSGHNGNTELDKTEQEKLDLLKSEIIAFKNHPALLSWYINDEPDGQGRSSQILEKAYNLIHELDSYHPVSIVFMMPSKFHEYQNTMDIAMTDPYPIPNSVDIRGYVQQLNHDFKYQKSIWLVPQAFGGQEMWPREPTAKEIRIMTYLGLIEGIKGVQYYIRSFSNFNPQAVSAWSECSNMAVEVAQMTPFLLSNEKQSFLNTNDPDVLAKSFSYKGETLIMVVNKSNQPKSFAINIGQSGSSAELWFENRAVEVADSMLQDMVDALGTRVYRISKKQASSKLIYSGNLIYNPSFEDVTSPGLSTGHNIDYGFVSKADRGATVFADSRQSVDGLFSMRMQTPVDSGGKKVRFTPIVLNAGNTYSVSVWAKAAFKPQMPQFRLTIEAAKQEKVFDLTTEWKKYSFMFKADSSTTNAIVALDVLESGTAWFDVLQVVPDPVLHYVINKDNTATVSVTTSTDNVDIKYSDGTNTGLKTYKSPFLVTKPTTVKAILFDKKVKLAESSSFVPVNKALGKTIRFDTPYHPQYPSVGDSTLTNGIMGTTLFRDKKWLGFITPEVVFTLDMKQLTDVNSVIVNFLCDPNSGIFLPRTVSVYTSSNGSDFQQTGQRDNTEISRRGEPYLVPFEVNCKSQNIRYIQFRIKTFGEISEGYLFKGSTSWLFVDEVLVK
jgi:hypothetical protein